MEELFAVALFVLVLVFIGSELANRTVVALIGAILIVAFGVVEQSEAASEFIDWNTIGLLAGMMIIVAILNKTGLFEYLAIRSAQLGKARPGRILILLSLVTAFLSADLFEYVPGTRGLQPRGSKGAGESLALPLAALLARAGSKKACVPPAPAAWSDSTEVCA